MELIVLGSVFVFVAIRAWKRRGGGDGGSGGSGGSHVEGGYSDDAGDEAGGDGGGDGGGGGDGD